MNADPVAGVPTFGDLLRQHRVAAQLTQEELAERSGLSARGISDLERGVRTHPYRETLLLLSDALALTGADRAAFLASARRQISPAASRARTAAHLPVPLTPLIGRVAQVAKVTGLLQEETVRLVTLTGPGGVGKTRLALAVVEALIDEFPEGAFFVDLAPLRDSSLVVAKVAAALGLTNQGAVPLAEVVSRFLAERCILLVLDNYEHLLDAATLVSELLQAGPGVKVLVTSREALRLQGEREYLVPPLDLPPASSSKPSAELAESAAVRLFVERAVAAESDFALTDEHASAVAMICQRLDGLPLAIELAAARIKVLPPAALLARLDQRLPLLTSGTRDAPARQRTLRDAIAWSYDLLTPEERRLLRRLSIFAGGWTLAAAEAIVDPGGETDVFAGLTSLVDKSMVRRDDRGPEPRFAMLETVREFGFEALTASGEAAELRTRHATWFLLLAERAEQALRGPEQVNWLDRLERERDNLRAAFGWALEREDVDMALRLAIALGGFWMVRGPVSEGATWLDRALSVADAMAEPVHARALLERCWMAIVQLDLDTAEELANRAMREARGGGLPAIEATALAGLAHVAAIRGNLDRAATLAEDADARYRTLGSDVAQPGERTLRARIEHRRGNLDRARTFFSDDLAYFRTVAGDLHWIAEVLDNLGDLDCDQGNFQGAAANYAEALKDWQAIGDIWGTADALTGFAQLAEGVRRPEQGARLLGAADAFYEQAGLPVPPHDRINYLKTVAAIRGQLGAEAYARAYGAGRTLTMAQAVAEAMALATRVTNATPHPTTLVQQADPASGPDDRSTGGSSL